MRAAVLAGSVFAALMALPAGAAARMPAPQCVRAGDLPPELAAWGTRSGLVAATHMTRARPALAVGRAVDLTLHPTAAVTFEATPGKTPGPDMFGGMVSMMVDRPGTYRVALGAAAWIDLLRGGRPIASTAHSHGPACTGVRKLVDFRLTSGRYTLQLSGAPAQAIAVEVVRVR